jgi:hypothetical protein
MSLECDGGIGVLWFLRAADQARAPGPSLLLLGSQLHCGRRRERMPVCRLLARRNWGLRFGLQKSFVAIAFSTPVGKPLKVLTTARFYEAQPHIVAAFQARHLDGDLKACAGWRGVQHLH